MRYGEFLESGTKGQLFSDPRQPNTKYLIVSEPSGLPEPLDESAEEVLGGVRMQQVFKI